MRFAILGPVEARADDGPIAIKNGRERFVLALLLLSADRLTPTDRIIDGLWDEPPPTARAQLHNIVGRLRRRLDGAAGDLIATRPLGYELRLGDHELDLLEFRRLVARARQAAVHGDVEPAADLLDEALSLWNGPALADIDDELASTARRKLDAERANVAEELFKVQLELGRPDKVLSRTSTLIDEHPHRERLYELRIRALAATGRRAEALETYQQAYRRLVDDLGVEPGPTLRELERQVLEGVEVGSPTRTAVTPRQLPAILTTLAGRDALMTEVAARLIRDDAPGPVTALLVGPGGIGKTTLATAVGHRVADDFPDGQLYADLRGAHADATDAHDTLGAFLRALGVGGSEVPDDAEERAALYRSLLADKRTLVLLDDAAGEGQVRPLLPGSAGCAVIVTSRQRLGALVDTSRWTVPGLQADDAVDLVGRIVGRDRVSAEPEAATAVVAACGHLPLAVSIAAARLAAHEEWSLAEFADRLTDERRRLDELRLGDLDVRANIALSYESLAPDHRRLLRRLGLVSAPDWPTWVAHELDNTLDAREIETALDRLTDAHLVEPLGRDPIGQIRFRIHDLVAEYAHERALVEEKEADRTDVVTRVLSGWLALASEADQYIGHGHPTTGGLMQPTRPDRAPRPDTETASSWFEIERINLVRAVADACQVDSPDLAAGLAIQMSGYLGLRAHDDDRLRVLQASRGCARAAGRDSLLDRVLRLLSNCVVESADPTELAEIAAEWLDVARRLDDPRSRGRASVWMGMAMLKHGRLSDADNWLGEGRTAAEACDDPALHAGLWLAIAMVRMESGRASEALAPMTRALEIQRRRGPSHLTAIHLHNYGDVMLANSRLAEAAAALQESTQVATEVGDLTYIAHNEGKLAEIDLRRERWSSAAQRLDRARQAHEQANQRNGLADVHGVSGELALVSGRSADAVQHFAAARRIWGSIGLPLNVARLLARLELAHRAAGDATAAEDCRAEWQSILDERDLDEACLLLPPFLTDS